MSHLATSVPFASIATPSSSLLELSRRHLSWFDHLSSADSELAAPLGWQKSGLSQDSTLTQILSSGVLALDNANTNKSL